jgi:hypothetical protein
VRLDQARDGPVRSGEVDQDATPLGSEYAADFAKHACFLVALQVVFGGYLYSHRWLESNVPFLRRTLTVSAIADVLQRVAQELSGEPEHEVVARLLAEMAERAELFRARCTELPSLLATTEDAGTMLEWSA